MGHSEVERQNWKEGAYVSNTGEVVYSPTKGYSAGRRGHRVGISSSLTIDLEAKTIGLGWSMVKRPSKSFI